MPTISLTASSSVSSRWSSTAGHVQLNTVQSLAANTLSAACSTSTFNTIREGGIRFTSVTVPQAAPISSAVLTVTKVGSVTGSPIIATYGVAADNAAVWATGNKVKNVTKTTANATLSTGTTTIATTVTTIVQEIVNRAGWVSGNAMSFAVLDANIPTAGKFKFQSATNTTKPTLSVIYGAGAGLLLTGYGS